MADTTVRFVFEDKGSGGGSGGGGGTSGGVGKSKTGGGSAGSGKEKIGSDFDEAMDSAMESLEKLKPALKMLPIVGKRLAGIIDGIGKFRKNLGLALGDEKPAVAGGAGGATKSPKLKGPTLPEMVKPKVKPSGADKTAKGAGVGAKAAKGAAGAAGITKAAGATAGAGITSSAGATAGAGAAGGAGAGAAGGAGALALLGGPVGIAIIAGVAVIAASVVATKLLIRANDKLREKYDEIGKKLAPFSQELQTQKARSEVAQLRQDIAFSRRLGPKVATFNEAEDRLSRAVERISLSFDEMKLTTLTPILELVATGVENLAEVAQLLAFINDLFGKKQSQILELLSSIFSGDERERNKLPLEADILRAFTERPDLNVEFDGQIWGDDEKLGRDLIRGAVFEGLPEIAIP